MARRPLQVLLFISSHRILATLGRQITSGPKNTADVRAFKSDTVTVEADGRVHDHSDVTTPNSLLTNAQGELQDPVVDFIRWNTHPHLCLDVQNGHNGNGAQVQMWGCAGSVNGDGTDVKWTIPASGAGPIRWGRYNDKCLDVDGGGTSNGNRVQIWDCGDGSHANMQWTLPSSGTGVIRWSTHPYKCLDVTSGDTHWGNKVQTWDCGQSSSNSHQQFTFPKVIQCGPHCSQCDLEAGTCQKCSGSKYLGPDGSTCVDDCPPGWTKTGGSGNEPRECKICSGSSRRRRADECNRCQAGFIPKIDSDECQNIQDTCTADQCEGCLQCMAAVQDDWKDCVLEKDPSAQCVNPGSTWCSTVVATLAECQHLSFGCFYKLRCQHPCICPEWKSIHCGGQTGSGTCNVNSMMLLGQNSSTRRPTLMQRAQRNGQDASLDDSIAGKCGA